MKTPTINDFLKYANFQMTLKFLFGYDPVDNANLRIPTEILRNASDRAINTAMFFADSRRYRKFTSAEAANDLEIKNKNRPVRQVGDMQQWHKFLQDCQFFDFTPIVSVGGQVA